MDTSTFISVNATEGSTAIVQVVEADCKFFNFVVWGCLITAMCLSGYLGNLLSFLALQRDVRSSAISLLQSLAVSDVVLLLSVNLTDAIPYICDYSERCPNLWRTWPYIRYFWLLTPIGHMCSIWLVVLVAANRYWAVCRPHAAGEIWSNRRTFAYVLFVVCFAVVFNIPRLFEYEIVDVTDSSYEATAIPNHTTHHGSWIPDVSTPSFFVQENVSSSSHHHHHHLLQELAKTTKKERKTRFGNSPLYKVGYKVVVVNILLVIVPLMFLFFTSVWIIKSLKHSERLRSKKKKNNDNKGGNPQEGRTDPSRGGPSREITFLLVAVVLVAVACQTPLAVFHFVRYIFKYGCGDVVFFLESASKLLVTLNSCINFIVYCVLSPRFRRLLRQLITCQGRQPSRASPRAPDKKPQGRADEKLPLRSNKQEDIN